MIVWIKQRGIHVHVSPNGNKTSTGKSIYTVTPAQNIWWFSATMSLGKGKKNWNSGLHYPNYRLHNNLKECF